MTTVRVGMSAIGFAHASSPGVPQASLAVAARPAGVYSAAVAADFDEELAAIAALTAEHLRCEMDMANPYLPRVAPEVRAPEVKVDDDIIATLRVLAEEAAACTRCGLHEKRNKSVFARGNPAAAVVFVGEGPGFHEDQQGKPFVGRAGELLDRMIGAMGFTQDEVYICNVVKCRPPENRTPNPDESEACIPFLKRQLEAVQPQVIVALGRTAATNLGAATPGRRWRGVWSTWSGIKLMPTYHPAYLLRNPENKRDVWQDLQAVVAALGRQLPSRGGR